MRVLSQLVGCQGERDRRKREETGVPNVWTCPVIRINIPQETVTEIETEPASQSPQSTGWSTRGGGGKATYMAKQVGLTRLQPKGLAD